MKIAVIGAGAWGTTLSILLAQNCHEISLWSFEKELLSGLEEYKENRKYLPGFPLTDLIKGTGDLKEACGEADALLFATPTQHLRAVAGEAFRSFKGALVLSASKGIEVSTLKRPTEILNEFTKLPACAISGPNLAKEIAAGLPAASVIAGPREQTISLRSLFKECRTFRVYTSNDVTGVELGGALKNVIAIAAGALEERKFGDNAKSALIVRGIAEISRLAAAMGGEQETLSGLSGLGDLITTCQSGLSRNHTVGMRLAAGEKLDDIVKSMHGVAEGISTARGAVRLAGRHRIEMPITSEVHDVLFEGKSIEQALIALMSRPLKSEY